MTAVTFPNRNFTDTPAHCVTGSHLRYFIA
nr:MAG TPA_asm: hypothetical protein [Caudoviricetes sp.]